MKHYVYKITNNINDKIYIGKHSSKDINRDSYLGSGIAISKAIKKYGRQNFTRQILYQCENQEDALNLQSILVDEQFILRNDNYNIVQGGKSGWKPDSISVKDECGNFLRINSAEYYSNKSKYSHPTKGRVTVIDSKGATLSIFKCLYDTLNSQYSPINKGKVVVKDCNGNIKRITTQQFYNTPSQYKHLNKGKVLAKTINNEIISIAHQQFVKDDTIVGINYGKVSVKDKSGRTFQVSKNDERFLNGQVKGVLSKKCIKRSLKTGQIKVFWVQEDIPQQFVGIMHNLIRVKDKDGNSFFVQKDDIRLCTGQAEVWSKNTVNVRDNNNNTMRISVFDERYINGQVVPENKGKILVKNKYGQHTTMYKTDPRYLSGQYYPVTKNMISIFNLELKESRMVDKNSKIPKGWNCGSGKIFIFNKHTNQRRKIYIWQGIPTGFSKGMK